MWPVRLVIRSAWPTHSISRPYSTFSAAKRMRRRRLAEKEIAISHEFGFPHYLAYAAIEEGLDGRAATGAELAKPLFLSLLAWAYGEQGLIAEGLQKVGLALEIAERTASAGGSLSSIVFVETCCGEAGKRPKPKPNSAWPCSCRPSAAPGRWSCVQP